MFSKKYRFVSVSETELVTHIVFFCVRNADGHLNARELFFGLYFLFIRWIAEFV